MNPYRRAGRIVVLTFVAYGTLVSAHLGEFWPFSVYPMFSQGGTPWSRAAVRDVTDTDSISWNGQSFIDLPGDPYPLLEHGVDPIDLANFLSKSRRWDDKRIGGLQTMFAARTLNDRKLLVMRVNGRITLEDSVIVEFIPYALLSSEATKLNPSLPR